MEMLEYVGDNPTADQILAAIHLKPRKSQASRLPQTKREALTQLSQLGTALGGMQAAPLPPHLREMANWAIEQQKRLNKAN